MSLEDNNASHFYDDTWWDQCTLDHDTVNDARRIVLFLLYLFIFVVGLVENTVVVWINWRRRHSANGVLFCIINMSLSDLMIITLLPFFMMEVTIDDVWLWGKFLCKATNLIYRVTSYSSCYFLAFMTLERYLSLTRPSTATCFPVEGRRRWLFCGGLWLLSFVLALLENVHIRFAEWDEPGCHFLPEHNWDIWYCANNLILLVFQFLVPGAIIITFNVLIARAVRTAPDVQGRRDVWLVHVYSLVFVVCWLPYHLMNTLYTIEFVVAVHFHSFAFLAVFTCNVYDMYVYSESVVQCLTLFHCIANPILYNFLSKSFRNNLSNTVENYLPRWEMSRDSDGTRDTA